MSVQQHFSVQAVKQAMCLSACDAQARVMAAGLCVHMWMQDKTNRIIGSRTYEQFCDVLAASSNRNNRDESEHSEPKAVTAAETAIFKCMHPRTHALLRQALGLDSLPNLTDVSFLEPKMALKMEPCTGYDMPALNAMQLQQLLQ
jgi:hypothetical protein